MNTNQNTPAAISEVISPNEVEVHLRWGDMDALAHVNNVQIARLFEESRVRLIEKWLGDDDQQSGERKMGLSVIGPLVIAQQRIEYINPLHYSTNPAIVKGWISSIGTSSFTFSYELRDAQGLRCALAEALLVLFDPPRGTRKVSPELRLLLEKWLAPAAQFRTNS